VANRYPARTAARRSRTAVYGRRRRRALVGAALVLRLAHAAAAGTSRKNAETRAIGMKHTLYGGHGLTAVGVVMGQGQGGDTSVILAAAGEAATQLVESAQN
jgi:hypothetical protein